jgi:hypothetical protein
MIESFLERWLSAHASRMKDRLKEAFESDWSGAEAENEIQSVCPFAMVTKVE